MEKSTNSLSWMHGLEEYFAFKGEADISKYCADFIKVMYSENKGNSLRNALINNIPTYDKDSVFNAVNFFAHTANSDENMRLDEICSALVLLFPDNDMLQSVKKFYRESNLDLRDAFSRGQVQSKIWLATELNKLNLNSKNILILAGWFGQLVNYIQSDYEKIRIVDQDRDACVQSDYVFNLNRLTSYKVKSAACKIEDIVVQKTGFMLPIEDFKKAKRFEEKFLPDLIINTSAEHMTDDWFNQIRFKELDSDPVVIIQSNNLFDIPEHINCVHSTDHMEKKFPMREILYSGEIQLQGYKRFMLIGRP
jgi:hypothetical protein